MPELRLSLVENALDFFREAVREAQETDPKRLNMRCCTYPVP